MQSLDQTKITVLVLLHLSAAFDTVDLGTLLNRLKQPFFILILYLFTFLSFCLIP